MIRQRYIPSIVVDSWAIDYLTLTTFDRGLFNQVSDHCIDMMAKQIGHSEIFKTERMQYTGYELNGMFWGSGHQAGIAHYMIEIKGGWADEMFMGLRDSLKRGDFSCSRVDIQITTRKLSDIEKLYDGVMHKWKWRGRKLRVKAHLGSDGLNSLEFGARKSDITSILYIKDLGDGTRGMRHETRYKGKQALGLLLAMIPKRHFRAHIKAITFNRLEKFPEEFEREMIQAYNHIPAIGEGCEGFRYLVDRTLEARFNWWMSSVIPATYDLLLSEYRDEIASQIEKMLRYHKGLSI